MVAADIGPGHEVLVPAHTFIATLWGVVYVGATPVLCDVDDATGTIDLADAKYQRVAFANALADSQTTSSVTPLGGAVTVESAYRPGTQIEA